MEKIVKNLTLAAVLAIAGSGCAPTYSKAVPLSAKTGQPPTVPTATNTPKTEPESLWSWAPAVLSLTLGTALSNYHANDKNDPLSGLHSKMTLGFGALPLITKLTNYDKVLGAIPVWGILTSEMFGLLSKVAKNPSTGWCFGWGSRISRIAEDRLMGTIETVSYLCPKLNPLNWFEKS